MKVILTDNHDLETVPDHLFADNLTEESAKQIADNYNQYNNPNWYAKAVPDDYRLSRGMEDLV